MRIISKFSDYYDSILAYGIDPTHTYVRKLEEIKREDLRIKEHPEITKIIDGLRLASRLDHPDVFRRFDPFAVLFCGEVHVGIMIEAEIRYMTHKSFFAYSTPDVDAALKSGKDKNKWHDGELRMKKWEKKYSSKQREVARRERLFSKKNIDVFFKADWASRLKTHDLHDEFGSPVIAMSLRKKGWYYGDQVPTGLTINPVLKDLQFFRRVPPPDAMRLITDYVSGVMGGRAPKMIEISNDDKISKHGYDLKYSFRKRKAGNG